MRDPVAERVVWQATGEQVTLLRAQCYVGGEREYRGPGGMRLAPMCSGRGGEPGVRWRSAIRAWRRLGGWHEWQRQEEAARQAEERGRLKRQVLQQARGLEQWRLATVRFKLQGTYMPKPSEGPTYNITQASP